MSGGIQVDEVFGFFQSVLEVYGYTTVEAGSVVKIVASATARGKNVETRQTEALGAEEDKFVTQLIHLNHVSPDDPKNLLPPLVSEGGAVVSHPQSGTLIVTDFDSNVRRLQQIIKAVDVPWGRD
jgi:general secretion pathway protein D